MMAVESKLRAKLRERVMAYGGEVRAVKWLGRRNAPDVLVLFPEGSGRQRGFFYPGGHVFVETKGTEKVSEAQLREHQRMRDAGCEVVLCRNETELNEWLPPL